jgi:hypothetical protein
MKYTNPTNQLRSDQREAQPSAKWRFGKEFARFTRIARKNAMKRQCAWCGQILGQSVPLEDNEITHGICPKCIKEMLTVANLADNAHRERDEVTATKAEGLALEKGVAVR